MVKLYGIPCHDKVAEVPMGHIFLELDTISRIGIKLMLINGQVVWHTM